MTVTFLGSKGGTGTTTMAVNVAAELRRQASAPTAIVDLKPPPGDVALFLGVRPRVTVSHLLAGATPREPGRIADALLPHSCGVDVLAASDEWGHAAPRDADGVEVILHALTATHRFVIVDAGATLNPVAATALQMSDLVVIVANPDVPCLRNLRRLVDAVRLAGVPGDRLRVLLNRISDDGAVTRAQIEAVLDMTIDWSVPSDYRAVAGAVISGAPLRALRASDVARHLESVARAIIADAQGGAGRSWTMVAPSADSGASQ